MPLYIFVLASGLFCGSFAKGGACGFLCGLKFCSKLVVVPLPLIKVGKCGVFFLYNENNVFFGSTKPQPMCTFGVSGFACAQSANLN